MNVTDENMTPAKEDGFEKRPKLKRIKKKKTKFDLNTSTNNKLFKSFQSRMNISAANSSVVKASLRANNKALAQSLEKVRQDLRLSYEVNNDLKKENQDLQLRLMNLERVAGLKDESLEKEVQRRIEDKTKQLKMILSSVSVHLLDAGSCLQDALDKCIDPTRLSVASSARHSSLGASDEACSPLNSVATSSIYYNPNTFSRVSSMDPKPVRASEPIPVDAEDPPEGMISRQQLQEMTMILEQSVLAEVEDLPEVTEAMDGNGAETAEEPICITEREESSEVTNKAFKTSRRSSGRHKDVSKSDLETPRSPQISSSKVTKEKQDRRGTFVIPSPVHQEETKASDEKALQNRRGTFVLSKPAPEEKNISKRAAKRETFVLKPSAVVDPPKESREEEKSLFKVPFPVIISSKDEPMEQCEDATVYLNTDMELTEVVTLDELAALTADMGDKEGIAVDNKKTDKQVANREQIKEKSKPKVGKSSSLTAISGEGKKDLKGSKSDTDISKDKEESAKSAVVLQLRKPGKIVFSAARKEYDGSRKALLSKLPTRPRSKSKKAMRELKESIAADTSEPKNIFDFHDKTPVHLTEKSRIEPSVYDLSVNESQTQSSADPDAKKDVELKTKGEKKLEVKGNTDTKCDSVSITYTMPLKGSPEESKPKDRDRSRSRGRAKSKTRKQDSDAEDETEKVEESRCGRSKGRQGRSKSRTRKEEDSDKDWEIEESKARGRSKSRGRQTRSRSQSRKRSADDDTDEADAEEVIIDRKSRSRRRKKVICYAEDGEDEQSVPKTLQDEEITSSSTDERQPCISEKTSEHNKSGKKVTDNSDDDFKDSVTHRKSGISKTGRSKRRKQFENEMESEEIKPSENRSSEKTARSAESATSEGKQGRGAESKSMGLNKNMAVHSNKTVEVDSAATKEEEEQKGHEDVEDDIALLDDSFKTDDLKPISSIDFISRISTSRQKSSAEDSNEEESKTRKASKSKGKIGSLLSETDDDDEVEVVTVRTTRTKDKMKTKKLASTTDDEVEEEDLGNKTKVVPASDDEAHSEDSSKAAGSSQNEETKTPAKTIDSESVTSKAAETAHSKENTNKSTGNSSRRGTFTHSDVGITETTNVAKESNKKMDKEVSINNTKSKDVSGAKTDAFSVPRKDSPGTSRGRSRVLKKVERCRSRSRKRGNVQDILQAFKEADDPDHSLRLNAASRNDSVVIAEVIKNACLVGDVEGEKFEKLCEALEETQQGEVYSLPLKDSPKESSKARGRARSQSRSRGRSRSKKRAVDSDDEDFVPPKPSKATRKQKNEETEVTKSEESRTYTLPLKGSPLEPKKSTRSRSQSRPRAGQRGRSQSRKRVDAKDESPEKSKPKESASREDLKVTFDPESPVNVRSRSVKKVKQKNLEEKVTTESDQFTPEKKSRRKVIARDESSGDKKFDPVESLNVTFEAESPSSVGKRSVKKVKSKPCEDEDKDKEKVDTKIIEKSAEKTNSNPNAKSTGKKSTKKKKEDDSVRKSQQAELKERFNELKRKLSMMPRSDRTSSVSAEKENDETTLKRKRESSEDNSDVAVEKRSRRAAAAAVSYKEPSVGAKLRRGDPGTSHFFSTTAPLKMFKSPLKGGKDAYKRSNKNSDTENVDGNNDRRSEDTLGKAILDNISNTVTTTDD